MKKIISVAALIALMLTAFPTFSAEAKKATVYHPVFGDMKVVTVGDKDAFKGGYKLWGNKEGYLGAKSFRPSAYSTTLASSLAERGSETTLKVNSITLKDGTSLAEANYGSLLILTVGTGDNEEKIAVSNLATSTKAFTIVSRGLEYGRWASSTANMKQHLPGERVYVSDDDHFLNQIYADLVTAETITGRKTFTLSPIIPTPTSSDLTYGANVEYVNNVATSGAADLSETVKGIGEGATQAEMQAGTSLGSSGAYLLLQNRYATSTPSATTSIPITKTNGKLNQGFIDLTEDFLFTNIVGIQNSFFGTGADGDVTVSAGTTTLSRDMFYNTLTVNTGAGINTAGYRIFVRGTLTNNGTIGRFGNNGNNGVTSTGVGGAGGATTTALTSGTIFGSNAGIAGGVGGTGQNSSSGFLGSVSYGGGTLTNSIGVGGANGTSGGKGGDYAAYVGADGGATSTGITISNPASMPRTYNLATNLIAFDGTTLSWYKSSGNSCGGNGGGSAGGNTGASVGGGGGGGSAGTDGGIVLIIAKTINNSSTGRIVAKGGVGGKGGGGDDPGLTNNGGGGGGGGGSGGSGGVVIILYNSLTNSGAIDVSGGVGGSGGAGGVAGTGSTAGTAGNNGQTGTTGVTYQIQL